MHRRIAIVFMLFFTLSAFAQEETRVVDSLLSVLPAQEGREKVLTMIELTWEFYDISFDDCISWGEKAVKEAQTLELADLEADAYYALGMQYGYHADLDLAHGYLKQALDLHRSVDNDARAFEDLWNLAYFELLLGNMDTAYRAFQNVRSAAEQRHDSLAYAQANNNLAYIQYQRNDFEGAIKTYELNRDFFALLNDSVSEAQVNLNLAIIMNECGRIEEARELFVKVIPQLEAFQETGMLLIAYKNYGVLFENNLINYDSASYYFEKVLACVESEKLSPVHHQIATNTKVDALAELGNVAFARMQYQQAIDYYEEARSLAESNGYHLGLMQAMNGLGQVYLRLGQASKSLQYLENYIDEAKSSGITLLESEVRKALVLDYARLGRFTEMENELNIIDEQCASLLRENVDLLDKTTSLQDEAQWLQSKYETQNTKIETLQSQRNHYRLAFFGLLAMMLFALAVWVAYKIVRKNRAKTKKG